MSSKLIDINKIDPAGGEIRHAVGPLPAREEADAAEVLAAQIEGRVERSRRGASLEARLIARVRVACGRCLDGVEVPIDQRFKLNLLLRPVDSTPGGEVRVDASDTTDFPSREGKVDLREILEEQIYLNLPLKTLCADDCLGLCPACGENRNRLECDCRAAEPDPRLSPLADLKKRMEGS